ncbi:MAG: helix-turn-helix domain-containing protein [Thermomicrobiales bacterium]
MKVYVPHPRLRPYVQDLHIWEYAPMGGGVREWLPDSGVELMFGFGAPLAVVDGPGGRGRDMPQCYRVGLMDRPITLRVTETVRLVGAKLHAWGAGPLLGAWTVEAAKETILPLDGTWTPLAVEMERALRAGDDDRAIRQLQSFLLARLQEAPAVPRELLAAAHRMRAADGQIAIGDLVARSGLSLRQLERGFKALAGVSPKALARTMRLECVLYHLRREPSADLATLAYTYGYADQAHLTREVRALTGCTPVELRKLEMRARARREGQSAPQQGEVDVNAILAAANA